VHLEAEQESALAAEVRETLSQAPKRASIMAVIHARLKQAAEKVVAKENSGRAGLQASV
jgi:hypothetical protein